MNQVTETAHEEIEIVKKALAKSHFDLSAEAGVNFEIAAVKGSPKFGKEASVKSQKLKKEFLQSVSKAAEGRIMYSTLLNNFHSMVRNSLTTTIIVEMIYPYGARQTTQ